MDGDTQKIQETLERIEGILDSMQYSIPDVTKIENLLGDIKSDLNYIKREQ